MESELDQITDRIDDLEETICEIPIDELTGVSASVIQELKQDIDEIIELGSDLSERIETAEGHLADVDSIKNRMDDLQEQVNGISQGGGDGWQHRIDGVAASGGIINFITVANGGNT